MYQFVHKNFQYKYIKFQVDFFYSEIRSKTTLKLTPTSTHASLVIFYTVPWDRENARISMGHSPARPPRAESTIPKRTTVVAMLANVLYVASRGTAVDNVSVGATRASEKTTKKFYTQPQFIQIIST